MRAAIYSPYLDTLGGGERYLASVAAFFVRNGISVDLEWKDSSIKEKLETRFGIDLTGVNIVSDISRGNGYDYCFWLSDGSIPTLGARKNILHFQVPFTGVKGKTLLNKMKFFRINKTVCNSLFTKRIVDKEYGINSVVVYPPVATLKFKPGKKEDLILYVGRFSKLLQPKRQDVLIRAFKELFDSTGASARSWKLVLAGGTEVGGEEYFKHLTELSKTYPIKLYKNPSLSDLKELYSRAKVFWTAAGYGIDEEREPKRVEHFGITLVEGMSSGCAPLAFAAGGSKEIIEDGVNGFLWTKTEKLVKLTKKLGEDQKLLKKITAKAREDSQKYSYERFEKELSLLL